MEALLKKCGKIPRKQNPKPVKKMYAKRKRPAGASAGPASNRANPNNLVELIVVLVILAILAAILVPALLGWIDEARNKQYVLEARNIYVAAQAVADEAYAASALEDEGTSLLTYLQGKYDRIESMSDIKTLTIVSVKAADTEHMANGTAHGQYTISDMQVTFTSQDGTAMAATMENGTWSVAKGSTPPKYVNTDDEEG